jgi:hypothetical protein
MKANANKITPSPDAVLDAVERRLGILEGLQQAPIRKPPFAIGDRVVGNRDLEGSYLGVVVGYADDKFIRVMVSFGDLPPRAFLAQGLIRPGDQLRRHSPSRASQLGGGA